MPLKTRRKRCHKLERLLSNLSTEDQAEFRTLCQFNPSYRCIQAWFEERGCEISLNGIFVWWRSTFPTADETRILRLIAMELEQEDFQPPYTPVAMLAARAAKILCDHSTGKLSDSGGIQQLVEKQLELLTGMRSLSVMSDLSKI